MSWTDERVDALKLLWAEGLSASQISYRLAFLGGSGLTRNAVIGKIHRLGLSGRATQNRFRPATPKPKRLKAAPKVARILHPLFESTVEVPVQIPVTGGVSILDLQDTDCRYPITGSDVSAHRFCGCKQHPGLPYCISHARVAYRPADSTPVIRFVPRSQVGIRREVEAARNAEELLKT